MMSLTTVINVPFFHFFVTYFLLNVLIVHEVATEGASLFYKEYMLRTDQLCPDLQDSSSGKDIDTANYPYKSVFKLVDHAPPVAPYHDFPCIFESKSPSIKQTTTVVIKAIYADKNQWNFSSAGTCSEHIKLKFQDPMDDTKYGFPKIVCKIQKTTATDIRGSYYHPMVWRYPKGKMGLSFSTFDLEHNILKSAGEIGGEMGGESIITESKPRFVQIVFSVYFGNVCSLRVQQYYIDFQKDHCNSSSPRFYQLCGAYDCSEERAILSQIGFWSEKARMEQIEKMVKYVKLKREETTYVQFLAGTLRAMLMPILFLVVFYVTRRLRQKKAASESRRGSTNHSNRRRNNSSQNSTSNSSGQPNISLERSNSNHAIYDIPVTIVTDEAMSGYKYDDDDLPPPYESLVPPPTYSEAIAVPSTSAASPSNVNSSTAESPKEIATTNTVRISDYNPDLQSNQPRLHVLS